MKDKVSAQLKAKFPGVNLSKTRLDKIAANVAANIATEDDIDAKLDELNDFVPFADIARADDRQRAADRKAKDEAEAKGKTTAPASGNEDNTDNHDDAPAWAKALRSELSALKAELAGTKAKNLHSELAAAAKAKGIPEHLVKRYPVGEGYDPETALQELETDWTEMKQLAANGQVGNGKVPAGTGGTKNVAAAIKNFTRQAPAPQPPKGGT